MSDLSGNEINHIQGEKNIKFQYWTWTLNTFLLMSSWLNNYIDHLVPAPLVKPRMHILWKSHGTNISMG